MPEVYSTTVDNARNGPNVSSTSVELKECVMTVTAIQIGLHPDVIDVESPDFAQFRGLTQEETGQGEQRQRRRPAGRRIRRRQLPHRLRRGGGGEGPHLARRQALRRRAHRRGRAPGRKQHAAVRSDRQRGAQRQPRTAGSCSTTRPPRRRTTSAAGIRTRPTQPRRADHELFTARRRTRRRCRTHRIDRGRRPRPVRPLGRRPRTLAEREPI